MNAHTPFDANQDWSNPYCRNSSNDPMVDALLGNAYHVVRTVYCNLGYIKHLYDFLSKYGVVICVQSEAELKTLTTEAKYARIYDKSSAGDLRVTDYLYVDDDRTGILPDDTTATGSWVKVATSNSGVDSKDGGYIPWVYNAGSANGGETSIRIPDETAGAPFMIVNGDWQTEGYDFEYDPLTFEIKFTTPLEQGDFVVVMRTGVPATPDNPNVSDWVTINWLYNHGAAVGGEQVIDIPYTFQSVPAVYKNGLRFCKGLANNSYTIDSDNNRIILTEPLATNDRLVIQLGGEAKILETVDHTIQEVARAANAKDSEVILSTDTTQVLNGKKVVYDVVAQRIYGLPTLPTNVYINAVVDGQLTYSPGNVTVTLLDSYQQQNTRELWRRSLAESGLTLVDGSFEEGATANNKTDAVWYIAGGQCYTWDSTFPKSVPADSTPESSGGINVGAWVSVGDASLRSVFSGPDGKGLNNFFGGSGWTGSNASTENIYNTADDTNNNALRWRYDVPSTDNQLPIAYLKKTITTTRDPAAGGKPGRWDEGTIYSHVKKLGGSAYAAGITSMFDAVGGTGDSVSIHARANGRKPHVVGGEEGSGVWGLWSFAVATPSDGTWIKQMLGLEIDCINNGQAIPFPVPTGQGAYIGAQITAVNGICSHGLEIGAGSGASWHRGIFIRQGAITPSNTFAGTSCIELEGGVFNKRVGGLNFGKGYFDYGINFAKPSEDYASLAAIIMGEGNRIYMGDSVSSANYIAKVAGQSVLNFQNLSIAINGTKVIGPRVTGIFQLSGTADGTTKNTETVTLQELARYVKKVTDALITHGLISPT